MKKRGFIMVKNFFCGIMLILTIFVLTGCGCMKVSDIRNDFLQGNSQEFEKKYSQPFELEFNRIYDVNLLGQCELILRDGNNDDFTIVAKFDYNKFRDSIAAGVLSKVDYKNPIKIKGVVKKCNFTDEVIYIECDSISGLEDNEYVIAHKYTFKRAIDDFCDIAYTNNPEKRKRLLEGACSYKGKINIKCFSDIGLAAIPYDKTLPYASIIIVLNKYRMLYDFDSKEFCNIFEKQEVEFVGLMICQKYYGLLVVGAKIVPNREQERRLKALMERYKKSKNTNSKNN